jgi:hypothetical protein
VSPKLDRQQRTIAAKAQLNLVCAPKDTAAAVSGDVDDVLMSSTPLASFRVADSAVSAVQYDFALGSIPGSSTREGHREPQVRAFSLSMG